MRRPERYSAWIATAIWIASFSSGGRSRRSSAKPRAASANIPIVIDDRALKAEGLAKSVPVTRNMKNVSLDAALTLMLDELKLAHKVENGVLVITTQKRAGTAVRGSAADDATPAGASEETYRTWSDNTGRFRIEAALVEVTDDRVVLKKKDGSTVAVPLSRLSTADQQWVRRRP